MNLAAAEETQHAPSTSADPNHHANTRAAVEALLLRYPDITEGELSQVLHFLAKGKHLDVGMVAGADAFRDKVAEIRKRHRSFFRPKPAELVAFLLATAGPVAVLFWFYLS